MIKMANIALIIAGGSGVRMGQSIPKQFINVNDKPVIVHTMECFQRHSNIDAIAVVCIEGWEQVLYAYASQFNITKLKYVFKGGENGQASIRNGVLGLEEICNSSDIVLIHDSIRPMVSENIITDCIATTLEKGNSITCVPCAEAMITTDDGSSSTGSYPRNNLKRTQTPQGFKMDIICNLHREALNKKILDSVASCTLMIELDKVVYFNLGSEKNVKLTTVDDIEIFKALLSSSKDEWLK